MESATSTALGLNLAEDFAPFTENKPSYFFAAVKAVSAAENERGKLDAAKRAEEEAKGEAK